MKLVGSKFTSSSNIHDPTLEKLDSSYLWILGTGPSPLQPWENSKIHVWP